MGLVAVWHVGSSRARDRTHVPCIGRWIPNHCVTREAPGIVFLISNSTWNFYQNKCNLYPSIQFTHFFLVMETFKIYFVSNFQIYNTVLLTIVTVLYITFPGLIYFIAGSLYFLTSSFHFTNSSPLPLVTAHLFSVSMNPWLFFFKTYLLFRFYI